MTRLFTLTVSLFLLTALALPLALADATPTEEPDSSPLDDHEDDNPPITPTSGDPTTLPVDDHTPDDPDPDPTFSGPITSPVDSLGDDDGRDDGGDSGGSGGGGGGKSGSPGGLVIEEPVEEIAITLQEEPDEFPDEALQVLEEELDSLPEEDLTLQLEIQEPEEAEEVNTVSQGFDFTGLITQDTLDLYAAGIGAIILLVFAIILYASRSPRKKKE